MNLEGDRLSCVCCSIVVWVQGVEIRLGLVGFGRVRFRVPTMHQASQVTLLSELNCNSWRATTHNGDSVL